MVIFEGVEYVLGQSGYFFSDVYLHCGNRWLHREVWKKHNGPIPKGGHIHHIDHDPLNNEIDNLELVMSRKEHMKSHPLSDEARARKVALMDRIRPLTKAWHASPEGRAKHVEIGGQAYKNFVPVTKPCGNCENEFTPKAIGNQDKFCSNACKSAWRRNSGLDNVLRSCANCGNEFEVNKYKKAACCSRSCGQRLRNK